MNVLLQYKYTQYSTYNAHAHTHKEHRHMCTIIERNRYKIKTKGITAVYRHTFAANQNCIVSAFYVYTIIILMERGQVKQ